jgi:short-subunit dehydrogenase
MRNTAFALITGASSGIGLAISRELAGRGHSLLLASNEEEKLKLAAEEIQSAFHVKALPLYMDLAQPGSAQKLHGYCAANNI